MSELVISRLEDGIRTISLNRPDKLNAIHRQFTAQVEAAFREANRDPETRVLAFPIRATDD